jgi:hypothetical protein
MIGTSRENRGISQENLHFLRIDENRSDGLLCTNQGGSIPFQLSDVL